MTQKFMCKIFGCKLDLKALKESEYTKPTCIRCGDIIEKSRLPSGGIEGQ